MTKPKTELKKFNIEIQKKSVKTILFIFFMINAVFFLIGYFVGKAANIKKINDSIIEQPSDYSSKMAAADVKSEKKENTKEADDTKPAAATNPQPEVIDPPKVHSSQKPEPTPKAKPVQSKPKSSSKTTKSYTLEIYSYKTQREAEQFRDILKVRGSEAFIYKTSSSRYGTLYKVRIGKFNSRQAANAEGKRLENKGIIPNFYIQEY